MKSVALAAHYSLEEIKQKYPNVYKRISSAGMATKKDGDFYVFKCPACGDYEYYCQGSFDALMENRDSIVIHASSGGTDCCREPIQLKQAGPLELLAQRFKGE